MAKQGECLTKRLAGAALASALAVIVAAASGIAVVANGGEDALRSQIGRASCRERVSIL